MNKISTRLAFTFLLGIFCSQMLMAQYFFKQYESPELFAFCSTSVEKTSDGYRMYAEKEETNTRSYLQLEVDENGNERSRAIVQFDVSEDRYLRLRDGNFIRFRKQASGAQAQKIRPNGQVLWTRNFSASVEGLSTNILENEGGAILLGYYDNSTPSQRSIYRLNGNNGAVEWISQIGTIFTTASSSTNKATRLRLTMPTNDGGVIYSVFVGSLYYNDYEYTFRVNGAGQQETETAFYFTNSDGYTFLDGKNDNAFKFNRTGFETPKSSSYVGDDRYTWSAFYNVKEYGSQFGGQGLMLSAATAAADGTWLLAGFKREYANTSNNIAAGTYQQEMHLARVDALGNEIFVNVNYPIAGLIKNVSELSDGRIMLSGVRDNMPWMLLVNSDGVPTDMTCPDDINGFSFQGDFRGHHYFLSDTKMPYAQAQQNAQANGGYIASVEDQLQHNLLYSVAREQNKNVFIGLNDLQSEGSPQWENDSPFDFQLFSSSTQNTSDNDVVSIVPWASQWVWENRFVERPYFLELDCEGENDEILDDLPEELGFTGCIGVPSRNYFEYDRLGEASSAEVAAGFNTTHWWKATDGDMETYMQTKAEDNASWMTRFGGYQFWVEELRIYPRTDGQFPLQNVVLEIGERYSNVLKTIPVQANGNTPIVVPVGSLATFVRLKREGFGVLSFAEIEIESCLGSGLFEQKERFYDIGIEFVCPDDIVLQADQSGTATLELDEEGEGFQLNCLYGGNGGVRRRGPQDGDELVPGEYLYEIESSNDVCGSQYCNVKITVLPFEGGDGELTLNCKEVVKIQYPAIETFGFRANWNLPTASTTCNISEEVNFTQVDGITNGSYTRPGIYSISYAASDACGNTATCTFQLEVIRDFNADCDDTLEGYDFLGEFEGHNYYMSKNDYPYRYIKDWLESQEIAQLTGGYLASINSAAENEFLRSKLGNNSVHIGYSNINDAATLESGESVTYTNIANNSGAAGYAEMNFWAGTWTLKNNSAYKPHILELPCGGDDNTVSEITLDSCEDVSITTEAGASGALVNWNVPTASTTCRSSSSISISQESGAANGTYFEVGTYSITYLLSDACENSVTCSFQVTVSAEENTDCPDTVEGFELLGEFENSKYYISDRNSQWSQASTTAVTNGGYLVSITSAAENDFLLSKLERRTVHIGYSNTNGTAIWESGEAVNYTNLAANSPTTGYAQMNFWAGTWTLKGNQEWKRFVMEVPCGSGTSGNDLLPDLSISNFTNIPMPAISGEIARFNFDLNNLGESAVVGDFSIKIYLSTDAVFDNADLDVGEIVTGNTPVGTIANVQAAINLGGVVAGNYTLLVVVDRFNEIVESNENNNSLSVSFQVAAEGEGDCPDSISGFQSLGTFNGSAYFLSNVKARPMNAQARAASNSGYLASIGSQAENDFLKSKISSSVYIGLNDANNEGTLAWQSGEAVSYQNFNICSFCQPNTQNNDYVVMANWDGTWSYSGRFNERKYIIEIPCGNSLSGNTGNRTFANNNTAKLDILELAPNPASDMIMAKVQSGIAQNTRLLVHDINGKIVLEQSTNLMEGYNEIVLPIHQLSAGVYVLKLQNIAQPLRFVKVE